MTTPANPTDTDTHLRLLTLGALFDGEFSINWLHELSRGKPQHILEALDLGRKNEWTTSGRPGFFVFKDREKQMALKESLAPKEREKCYRRITDVLLEASLEDPEIKEALARSLLNVENDMDGCRRLYAEGESIARQNREPEALRYYIKAIKDLGRLNGKEADRLLLETTIEYALVSMTELETEQVISDIHGALERAKSRSFVPQRALLKTYLAVYEFFRSEFESSRLHFEEGLALAKDLNDEKTKRSIRFLSVVFLFFQGQYRETLNLFEEFVPEIDRVPQVGVPIILRPQHGSCLANCGQVSQGLGMVRATIHIGRKLKSSFVTGLAEFAMGRIYVDIGRFGEAVEVLESALEKAEGREHSQFKAGVLMFLAYANHKLGRNEPAMAALTELQKTTGPFQARSNPFPQIMHLCWSMDQGKLPRLDGYDLEQQISKGLRSPNVYMKGMAYRHKALIAKKAGRPNREVIEEYRHALKWLEMSGHEMGIAKIKLELAGEYLASGDEEQARSLGEPAIKFLLSINRNLIPKELLHLEKEFRTSEAMLKEIFQLGQELVAIRDNRKLVGHIISTANRFTGTERGAIFLLEKDSDQLVLRASKNLTSEDVASPRFKDSMKIIVETSRSGEGQAIEFESPFKKEPPSDDPIGACICVPMILRNSAFGVLYHDHFDSQKGFKDTDLEVLNYFAAQAAIAMDNAQAYEALEEMVEKQQEKSRYFEAQYLEHQSFENIVGKSPAIQQVFHHIESVAATDTTVLVLGETGVGKELVARAIHRNSPRQAGPFIRVNCSAFTENLIASELFGHE
ncbi:MAG: GAF domain-containing protein, partial [Proteobacteria bacterium]|nr:GAF domain-containing protein [Pseudomonadota bacterium]